MKIDIIGGCALIDDEDLKAVQQFLWYRIKTAQTAERFYAIASKHGRPVYMHRLIMKPPPGMTVDHIDGNGLDNRRSNLRLATRSQNNANKSSRSASGFRGVEVQANRFRAFIGAPLHERHIRTKIHLGSFMTAEEAARAFDKAAKERHGEFARLNFPEPEKGAH